MPFLSVALGSLDRLWNTLQQLVQVALGLQILLPFVAKNCLGSILRASSCKTNCWGVRPDPPPPPQIQRTERYVGLFIIHSGGSRNLERGVQSPAREARRKFLGRHADFRSHERIHTKYSWKAEPRGPSQKKSRTLSDSVVLVNYNFN